MDVELHAWEIILTAVISDIFLIIGLSILICHLLNLSLGSWVVLEEVIGNS